MSSYLLSLVLLSGCESTESQFGEANQQSVQDNNEDDTGTPQGACSGNVPDIPNALMVDGEERTFLLKLPDSYDGNEAMPLIFALHGLGGSGALANAYFGLNQVAGSEAIIVYPDALPRAADGGETGWELDPSSYDFDFFDALYEELTTMFCVNTDKVYVTGHSYGGYMSNQLGCNRGHLLAAIAPVAGGGPWAICHDPVATLIIHGSNDDVVEFSQGTDSLDHWLQVNSCNDTTAATDDPDCISYDDCSEAVYWCEHDGEHEWPSFAPQSIWSFFASQSR